MMHQLVMMQKTVGDSLPMKPFSEVNAVLFLFPFLCIEVQVPFNEVFMMFYRETPMNPEVVFQVSEEGLETIRCFRYIRVVNELEHIR